jgi:hypothetical protein
MPNIPAMESNKVNIGDFLNAFSIMKNSQAAEFNNSL